MSWTVRTLLAWAVPWLANKGVETARLDAELLLANALGCDRVRLYIDIDKPLTEAELAKFKPLVQRRGAREPVAYILGIKEFYGRPFEVAPGVFIPRPETELLVQLALAATGRVLDLCAGSGAVGITIAAERPETTVDLVELSPQAAAVAARNAEKHAKDRARVFVGDLYAALPERVRYNAIVANPPYVPKTDQSRLAPDVVDHEPHLALFAGEDGLDVMRKVIAQAPEWLAPQGLLAVEIDPAQGETAAQLFAQAGFREVRVDKDLAGLQRHVAGRL